MFRITTFSKEKTTESEDGFVAGRTTRTEGETTPRTAADARR
ncbi:hypothetical protein ZOD2009_06689 [Haladaptatus paucihalophilus DX253]|uniref:Uncharacterized protein n=1 Tax=Haladaptatus paucihalophilus DX253 TaxID=797209 RepID=E7QRB5_HALPU|nr:hypothetical protein ZOD2009_06689 [Haladaptatus paucihalophilus DX253]